MTTEEQYAETEQYIDAALEKGELYQVGEIPPYWANIQVPILRLALTFGLVIPEYTMKDYVLHAAKTTTGYETIDIWGPQGSKKSCRTLSIAHWVYQDWDTVLEEIVLMPDAKELPSYEKRGFIQKMQGISKEEVAPLVAWDDYTVGMPSSTYKTDIEVYGAVDSAWAAIRTKVKVMVLNCPLIDRIGRNVKDNITLEVMLGRNQVEQIERFVRLIGLKHLESNFFKVQVEPLHRFDYRQVPKDVFDEYFDLRKEIADYAIHKMGKAFKDEASILEDSVTPFQIMAELPISPDSLHDKIRRCFLPSKKVNGRIYIDKKDYAQFKQFYLKNTTDLHVAKKHLKQ
jgi:hypothetical protein